MFKMQLENTSMSLAWEWLLGSTSSSNQLQQQQQQKQRQQQKNETTAATANKQFELKFSRRTTTAAATATTTITDKVLAKSATTTTEKKSTATTLTTTTPPTHCQICVLCRQKIATDDQCCCCTSSSSSPSSSTSTSTNDNNQKVNAISGKQKSKNHNNNNINNNNNHGRHHQQQEQQQVSHLNDACDSYWRKSYRMLELSQQFEEICAITKARAFYRLNIWKTKQPYNKHNQQQQQLVSNCATSQQQQQRQQQQHCYQHYNQQQHLRQQLSQHQHHHHHHQQQQHQHRHHHRHNWKSNLALIIIMSLLAMHATAAIQLPPSQQQLSSSHHQYDSKDLGDSLAIFTSSPRIRRESGNASGNSIGKSGDSGNTQVRLSRNETMCKSMDIRNYATNFNQLTNCTIIEGFLLITLINDAHLLNTTYPLLTEVTEYIIVYRVHNLLSLSQIFPNLSVIRGNSLFDGYALVVYQNRDLQDIGLSKLRAIANGAVRFEKNLSLCFLTTVDWSQIISKNSSEMVSIENRNPALCSKCPGEIRLSDDGANSGSTEADPLSCKKHTDGKRYCWGSRSCQSFCPKECPDNCYDEHTCCNKACLGGCVRDKSGSLGCISCRYVSIHNNTCLNECPKEYFLYGRRCITAEMCRSIGTKYESTKELKLMHFDGQCTTRCPKGFQIDETINTCVPCNGTCEKRCEGGLIDSGGRAREFYGCTKIGIGDGLVISIKRGGPHIMEDLEYGLAKVHTIETYLKVHLTYGLSTLAFFKSLRQIRGNHTLENRYALYVLENNDLEEIWAPNQTVEIANGSVFFHFNPKLCMKTIKTLLPMLASKPTAFEKTEVAGDSNGNKGSCNTTVLNVGIDGKTDSMAVIFVNQSLKFDDLRTFIGYQSFHTKDPYGNATKNSYHPCDESWTASEPIKEDKLMITNLQPYTQYAYYVKTWTISSESQNGLSPIQHFTTLPAQPTLVQKIKARANSSSEIEVQWEPPRSVRGKLHVYLVKAVLTHRDAKLETHQQRNYCWDPLPNNNEDNIIVEKSKVTDKQPTDAADCQCNANSGGPSVGVGGKGVNFEQNRREEIEFENALQNFLYVRRQGDQNHTNPAVAPPAKPKDNKIKDDGLLDNVVHKRRRRRRELDFDDDDDDDLGMGSVLSRHVRSTETQDDLRDLYAMDNMGATENAERIRPETWLNETRKSADGTYYEILAQKVGANQTKFVFTNLRHFSLYTISVVACREEVPGSFKASCGNASPIDKLTRKLENADLVTNVTADLESANATRPGVRLRWLAPLNPNGAIVSYTIGYKLQMPDQQELMKCVTVQDYLNLTDGYVVKHLSEGNYSFHVRANSMAGDGIFSELVYVVVPPPPTYMIYYVFVGVAIIMCLSGILIFVLYKKKKMTPRDLYINTDVNPFYASLQYIPDDWEVARDCILQLGPLGQGSFGMVYEGILKGHLGVDTPCAIKTVNENATDRERVNFLSEASVMKEFDTFHVVHLLGVCSRGQPALVVMELMKKGDLKSYLRAHRPDERNEEMLAYLQRIGVTGNASPPTYSRIYQMAIEIADGMAYLSAKKFVHRDLAARNCMVSDDLTVKIGDFGMTRDIYETDYYRKGTKGLLPVRWMPPESLRDGVYASSSDVFSFGVVLWEMATLASQPYQGLSNEQVLRYVIDGGIMERPENCPDVLHKLMHRCWHHRPSARPSFLDIIAYLEPHSSNAQFKDVSFYHSEAGLQFREKDRKEKSQMDAAFVAEPLDQDQEDATTPLRIGDYQSGYKSNMDQNASLEQPAESPINIVEEQTAHSPFSLQSGFVVSSTPDAPTAGGISHDDTSGYVQPDADALASTGGDRGYEIYDPSPNFAELPTSRSGSTGAGGGDGKLSGEQHLLPRKNRRTPIIMSSSMPDDVVSGGAGSLQPSTASAGSSNASSNTGGGSRGTSSLKKIMNRSILFNRPFFNHKRTSSNASQKSNSSITPSTCSIANLTPHPIATSNLGTIESGGSGSAGSYAGTPRFYTPAATPSIGGVGISDNPNYKLLDESIISGGTAKSWNQNRGPGTMAAGLSDSEQATMLTTSSLNPNYELMQPPSPTPSLRDFPNYVQMNEPAPIIMSSINPNYEQMQAPHAHLSSSDEEDLNENDDDCHEDIKMERMPLSRQKPRSQYKSSSQTPRSRSVSQNRKKNDQNATSQQTASSAISAAGNVSNKYKENWLRQAASTNRPPPPNGFIGREA
ncbi:insulin-like receptor [Drosophila tropicalis]|uniref:insulin-like receptor n=1 Tax=Drosophila tropicalis TaxID=46794 RepID=UPI0035ABDAFC